MLRILANNILFNHNRYLCNCFDISIGHSLCVAFDHWYNTCFYYNSKFILDTYRSNCILVLSGYLYNHSYSNKYLALSSSYGTTTSNETIG